MPVDEESVLSGNVAWESSEGFTLFKIPYVRCFAGGRGVLAHKTRLFISLMNFIYLSDF